MAKRSRKFPAVPFVQDLIENPTYLPVVRPDLRHWPTHFCVKLAESAEAWAAQAFETRQQSWPSSPVYDDPEGHVRVGHPAIELVMPPVREADQGPLSALNEVNGVPRYRGIHHIKL